MLGLRRSGEAGLAGGVSQGGHICLQGGPVALHAWHCMGRRSVGLAKVLLQQLPWSSCVTGHGVRGAGTLVFLSFIRHLLTSSDAP